MRTLDVGITAFALVAAIILLSGLADHGVTEASFWARMIPGAIANGYVATRITVSRREQRA